MENLVASDRFQRFYNCSFYDYESVPRMARKNMLVGIILLMLYAVFEILYLPCLAVFARRENIRESCYKLMLFMGILSMINIHSSGLIIGVYAIRLYCAESLTAVILALNRCIEMWDNRIVRILFDGHRMYCWMASVLLYGFVLGTFTIPPLPNGMLVGWFWNPHIAYVDDKEGVVIYF
uniref:G_PROTEIN_RECEP_F1_2 domain-containing protein n=1 Tax=Globodera pallida TaxID=36090 RepID=A0A183BIS4_GLOPA